MTLSTRWASCASEREFDQGRQSTCIDGPFNGRNEGLTQTSDNQAAFSHGVLLPDRRLAQCAFALSASAAHRGLERRQRELKGIPQRRRGPDFAHIGTELHERARHIG